MVDHPAWLDGQPTWAMPTGPLLAVAIVLTMVFGIILIMFRIALGRFRETTGDDPALTFLIVSRALTMIPLVIVAGFAMFTMTGFSEAATLREPFAAHTERVFAVTRFNCTPTHGNAACSTDRLPADRTDATWLKNGRLVQGVIVVNGTKVSLYDNQRQPVTPAFDRTSFNGRHIQEDKP
ncbi:hypothetical protein COO72_10875 [Bifidobacterium callitrichos]|nr:hypothetical protein COO72_10875 [Bifidobacterium callitrichos]